MKEHPNHQHDHQPHGDHPSRKAADAHAGDEHAGHGVDHSGHERIFRNRFWISLILSIPVLLYSPSIQNWLGFTAPAFPGSQWISPVFATIVFIVSGIPFIKMAVPEIRRRKPGMMTLITLAISVTAWPRRYPGSADQP